MRIVLVASICLFAWVFDNSLACAEPEPRVSQFSGKLVPRFESLRYSTVNGRAGPSLEHPIRWRYERAGLPVLILKESPDWRWVRDPEGEEVWVHARMLSNVSTAMVQRETMLKVQATSEAEAVAILQAGAIVSLKSELEGWTEIMVNDLRGWVESDALWGEAQRN